MNEVKRVLEDVIESLEVIANMNPTNSPDLLMKNARRLASLLPLLGEAATKVIAAYAEWKLTVEGFPSEELLDALNELEEAAKTKAVSA
jgi:hypothetical protein